MRCIEEERERLKALFEGHVWAANGQPEPATGRTDLEAGS